MSQNAVVKYRNGVNKISLGGLNSKEQDIFFAILFKTKNQESKLVEFEFSKLESLINDKKHKDRTINNLRTLAKKLAQLTQEIETPEGDYIIFNLFNDFVISVNKEILYISVNENLKFILNDLMGNFTKFELKHLVSLKSSYSKIAFRLFKQFETTGWYDANLNDFRFLFGVPSTYKLEHINQRVLNPILKELPEFFPNLKLEKIKKGRKIVRLKFTWDIKPVKVVEVLPKEKEVDESLQSNINAVRAAIPILSDYDIEVLLDAADVGVVLEKYYTLAVGKDIKNLSGFLISAIKNDWKTVVQAEKEFKKETAAMDPLEAKLQKRLFKKIAEKEKNE